MPFHDSWMEGVVEGDLLEEDFSNFAGGGCWRRAAYVTLVPSISPSDYTAIATTH